MAEKKLEEIIDLLAEYGGFDREYLRDKLLTGRSKPKNKSEAEDKMDGISRIKDITLKIAFHENRIAMHKSAIKRLRKEKSILMMNGEWAKDGRG